VGMTGSGTKWWAREPGAEDGTVDAITRLARDLWPHLRLGPQRVAHADAPCSREELLHERVVDRFVHQHAAGARAALSRLHERSLMCRQHRRGIQVGAIVELDSLADVHRVGDAVAGHLDRIAGGTRYDPRRNLLLFALL